MSYFNNLSNAEMNNRPNEYVWSESAEGFVRRTRGFVNFDDDEEEERRKYDAWCNACIAEAKAEEEFLKAKEEEQALRKLEEIATVWNYGVMGGLMR